MNMNRESLARLASVLLLGVVMAGCASGPGAPSPELLQRIEATVARTNAAGHRKMASAVLHGKTYEMSVPTKPVDFIRPIAGIGLPLGKNPGAQGTGFQDALVQALQSTSSLQKESGRLSKEFQLENSTACLEETLLAGADQQEVEVEVELEPAGDRLEAKGSFKVAANTKVLAVVSLAGKSSTARFVLK